MHPCIPLHYIFFVFQFVDRNWLLDEEIQAPRKCVRHLNSIKNVRWSHLHLYIVINKGNNKITELRTILQRESPNS
jgi:hypothetical protein